MADRDAFADRGRSLEDEYFHRKEKEVIEKMRRQSDEIVRRAREMSRHPGAANSHIASYGNVPAGGTSTTVVSVSNNGQTCTRTTEVVSQGPGKPPKVTSNVIGQCAPTPAPSSGPVNPA